MKELTSVLGLSQDRIITNRNELCIPKTIPEKAHPLVKTLFKIMMQQGDNYYDVSKRSGVSARTIRDWRRGRPPDLVNIEACLNVYGCELITRYKKADVVEW